MSWKQMTIGRKIAAGFGVVLTLLVVVGFLSYSGVGKIVRNADEVIYGNELDGLLAQMEVDHLNWANKVNELLTNDEVSELEVQVNDRKCELGKWLYGDGRNRAEALVPSLAPILKEIEASHRKLHESAKEIGESFQQPHSGLALTLSNRLTDHINWVGTLGKAIASEAGGLYSYQTELKSAVEQAVSVLRINANESEGGLKTRQQHALHIIEELRYGDQANGYFFILDERARMVMHPFKPELEGKDVSGNKDPNGKLLFTEMTEICRKNGEGFVTYQWPLPGSEEIAPKLTYVKIFKPWGWIVGSGIYLDHTDQALLARADDFAAGKPFSSGVQLDPTKCALGKFLNDPGTKKIEETFPEFKAAIDAILQPHEHLHQTAEQIEENVNQLEMRAAIKILNSDTQKTLGELKSLFNKAIEAENRLQEGLDDASRVYIEKTTPNLSAVQSLLNGIREEAGKHTVTDAVMLKTARNTKRIVTMLGIVAVVAGALIAFLIAGGIVTVLKRISGQMDEGAGQVASAAGQVSSSSQQLAEGSSEQAASIEEVASSLEEMSSMTKQNADNANEAKTIIDKAKEIVDRVGRHMGDMAGAIGEITKSSEETSKIIKTIDEIAFQTNLLALNAAVEAARAGEAGAGFAVVADEVRNLAMRAADAAKNTANLIEETIRSVQNGNELTRSTQEAFKENMEISAKVGELVSEIAAASSEQAHGIEQVNKAVYEMEKVVQQNAATAEESASASEELSAQAEQMKGFAGDLVVLVGGSKK